MWSVRSDQRSRESHSRLAEGGVQHVPASKVMGLREMSNLIKENLIQIIKVRLPGLSKIMVSRSTVACSFVLPKATYNVPQPQKQRRHMAKASQKQSGEGQIKSQAMPCIDTLTSSEIDVKINDLVRYLLYKYVRKEPATKAEMLTNVIGKNPGYNHMIFSHASECLLLVFGIDMKEVVPCGHTYVTVAALDLTYDGMLSEIPGIPKTGLLILVLSIIFMEYYHAREEVVWRVLNDIGVFAERDHFMYGRPRKLITVDFVQEGYLKYQQVPYAFPVCYEFLWGTRACAEISQMKILEFLYKFIERDPRFQPRMQCGEALRDKEERAKASIASAEDGPVMRRACPSALAASSEDKGQAVISVVEGEAVAAGTTV